MIKIKDLHKSFDKNEALKGVSLELAGGQIAAIMGPNGSGKTTLLKCLLGLVKPTSGEIYVKGMHLNGDPEYRRSIGYMPQYTCFPENLRVKEVMDMLKDIRGNHCVYDNELIEKLQIENIYSKPIGTLSGGTKQRVNCAAAFLFNQEIIILDEPTAGLDPVSSEIVKNKILQEKEKGKLVIITSHIVSEVESLADRIIYMLEGNICFDNNKEELYRQTGESSLNSAIAKLISAQSRNENGNN